MNTITAYVDSQPSYSCPIYCEIDHKHFMLEPNIESEPAKQDSLHYLVYLGKEVAAYEEE
jgi:hypothetical protein